MAKKILAIFVVSILLCSYIIPTTSALADVVVGDNDSYAVTELGVKNGKRIATMEAMLQLLESGVSEINFNDISDLDDYIDDFYDELTNVNYQDVSNEILAGAYNDVKELKKWIDDRGEYIGTYYKDYLNSADEGLSDIFNDFQLKLPKSQLVGTSLNGFRSMSRFNNGSPTPNPDINYNSYINTMNGHNGRQFTWWNMGANVGGKVIESYPATNYSWCHGTGTSVFYNMEFGANDHTVNRVSALNLCTLYINNVNDTTYIGRIDNITEVPITSTGNRYQANISMTLAGDGNYYVSSVSSKNPSASWNNSSISFQGTLSEVFEYFAPKFRNVNIYVDGNPWAIVGNDIQQMPTLDIDGFIKLYGNDNPIQYEFPKGTQIDYNALYTTIYNAIRDNLPLDMNTVNNNQVYYDSHDTVYSPTIYNYYGKDGDDENDWIDSILDYATIPDFNSVLGTVAVLDAPFVNGVTIINAGVTDVIPSDILIILGGFFVLVLFVCIINRMSE